MTYARIFVKTSAGAIHMLEAGSGPPLIFLHGWSADAYTCVPLLRCLATTYRVLVPTLPGWHPSYALEEATDPAEAFRSLGEWLDRVRLQSAILVGHSLGGVAAAHLYQQRPNHFNRLVLVDAVGAPFERDHETWKKLWLQKRLRMYRTHGVHVVRRLDRALLKHAIIRKHHLGRMSRYARTANILPLLEAVTLPVEFLWGTADGYTPVQTAQTMASHCQHASITEVPGDHDWPLFTPHVLLNYLTTHAASSA